MKSSPQLVSVQALVLGRVDYAEADVIVSLFTDQLGKLSALARGARRSKKRFIGALEPLHTLQVELNERPRGELFTLHAASLSKPRTAILQQLSALSAAGTALSWVKKSAPEHQPEPQLWRALCECLDNLGQSPPREKASASAVSAVPASNLSENILGAFGLRLLSILGWQLNWTSCVVCNKPCPPEQSAQLTPERGGLICQGCGGGALHITAEARRELHAIGFGAPGPLSPRWAALAADIVERALSAHLGLQQRTAKGLG